VGQNFFNYAIGILDSIYVGHFLDTRKLGLFTKARDLAYAPVAPFLNIVMRVGFPAYAQIQEKTDKVRIGFVRTLDAVLTVIIPLAVILLVEGGVIVQTLLGSNWLSLVLPLKIFTITTIFRSLADLVKPVFDALGKPEVNVKINAVQLFCMILFMYVGVHYWGLTGVVLALAASWCVTFSYAFLHVKRLLKLGWKMMAPTIVTVFVSAAFTVLIATPSYVFWMKDIEDPIFVFSWLGVFSSFYLASLWFMGGFYKTGPKHTFLSIVREIRNK
jgi:O-antigen/teichoic acid export membrane protein